MKTPRLLSRWGLVSLNGHGPYLAGYEVGQGTRTSTPLLELDPDLGTALTSSGRPYFFNGEPDPDYGLATALDVWGQYFGLAKSTIRSLNVDEAAAMITANGNTPYNRTIEEENALRRKYGVPEVADESEILRVSDVPDLIAPDPDPEEIESYESFGRGTCSAISESTIPKNGQRRPTSQARSRPSSMTCTCRRSVSSN
mgnify:CR=1 FL=1|jgi:hypothetical protein